MSTSTSSVAVSVPQDLKGKVAIVTGASSGIGRATALEFASRGASVVLGARRLPELEAIVKQITSTGGKAIAVKLDVTDEKDQANIVKVAVEKFGGLNIAFNNAGILTSGLIWEQSKEDFEKVYSVNVTGVFLSMKHQIPALKASKGGVIINNASVVGEVASLALKGFAAYSSTKRAVIGLSEQVAADASEFGIRVVVVNPGATATEGFPEKLSQGMAETIALPGFKKAIDAKDIAKAVAFLASDDARFITATGLTVAGGAFKVV